MSTFSSIQRTAKTIFWAVILILAVIGIIAVWDTVGKWITLLGGGIVALFGGVGWMDRKEKLSHKIQPDPTKEKREELSNQVESWREKVDRLRRGGLMVLICVLVVGLLIVGACPVRAGTTKDIYIPEDYEELKALYIAAWGLLDEADKMILEYQSLADEQAEKLEDQAAIINDLQEDLYRLSRPAWGLTGGLEIADVAKYKVGIAYKKGILSYAAGFGGGDFCIWGSVTVWWQSPF